MKKVYYIQPSYRKMDGEIVKGWVMFNASITFPILSAATPDDWEKSFCLEYFDEVDYDTDASVVCLTSMNYDIMHAVEIAERFKQRGKKVIFGAHPDAFSDLLMRRVSDSVYYGIPDRTRLGGLLNDALAGRLLPEYDFGVRINQPFDYGVYAHHRMRMLPALASAGCKNQCSYCCYPETYKGRYHLRKIPVVLEDLRSIRQHCRIVAFKDANLYNNRKYLLLLCEAIRKERLGLKWGCQVTIDIGADSEALRALRKAGCGIVVVGLETLDQRNLQQVGKPYEVAKYREWIRSIRKAGLQVIGYFMLGFDHDTAESVEKIYDFVHDTRLAVPYVNIVIPVPGTRLFKQFYDEDRLLIRNEDEFAEKNPLYSVPCGHCLFRPKRMSVPELEDAIVQLSGRLTTLPEIIRRSLVPQPFTALNLLKMNLDVRKEYRKLKVGASLPRHHGIVGDGEMATAPSTVE